MPKSYHLRKRVLCLTLKSRWICSKMSSRLLRRIYYLLKKSPSAPLKCRENPDFLKNGTMGNFEFFIFKTGLGLVSTIVILRNIFFSVKKIFILVKISLVFNGVKLNFFDFFPKISEFLRFLNRVKWSEIMTFFTFLRKKQDFHEKVTVI